MSKGKQHRYAVLVNGEFEYDVNMTPTLAKKLREHSRVALTTYNPRDGVRVG